MTIRIPDTLHIENSEKYKVSIRLRSGGLSFSGFIPSLPGSFFYCNVNFNRNTPYIESLKELFYSHDFFAWMYKEVNILFESSQYTLVPQAIFNESKKEDFLRFNFMQAESCCLTNMLKEEQAVVVYGVENEVYEFCARSFINPRFIHHIVPQICFWKQQNSIGLLHRMFVVLHSRLIDIVLFDRDKLVFVNSFAVERLEDIIYIILYVWRQTGLDQQKDQLHIFGERTMRNQLTELLSLYLQYISPVEIPSEAYLLGSEMAHTPIDIIALAVCE